MWLVMFVVSAGFFGVGVQSFSTIVADVWWRWQKGMKKSNKHLHGFTSAWYFPVFISALAVCYFARNWLFAQNSFVFGSACMLIVLCFEYINMSTLKLLNGSSPSERAYRRSRFHIHGRTKLTLGPLWFGASLLFKYVFFSTHNEGMIVRLVALCVFFGFFGKGMESCFTAGADAWSRWQRKIKPNLHLRGYTSAWYFPLYTCTPVMFLLLGDKFFTWNIFIRGTVYALLIFGFEFGGMWVLRQVLGTSPSEKAYRKSRWHVGGLIKLTLAPAWFWAGLLFEYVYRSIR